MDVLLCCLKPNSCYEEVEGDSGTIDPAGSFFRLKGILVTAALLACKFSAVGGEYSLYCCDYKEERGYRSWYMIDTGLTCGGLQLYDFLLALPSPAHAVPANAILSKTLFFVDT